MDTEKNISLTIKQPDEENNSFTISFSTIFSYLKRYCLIWIIIAVITSMFGMSALMFIKTNVVDTNVTALVSFNYSGIESGVDPYGRPFDVNKIKSPSIIETALTNLNEPLTYVEKIRQSISIEGIISDRSMEKLELYQGVYSEGGSAGLEAAEKLLSTGTSANSFIITLDYGKAELELNQSKQILNGILKCYQNYFFTTYGYNKSLGTSVVAVDYAEYDYSAAIDILSSTLSTLNDYVVSLEAMNSDFRSGRTGYSFGDLSATIQTLRTADLDSLSSYVIINNVTNDKSLLMTYYEYKIEQLKRNQNVYQVELDSIANSISEYEKDTMLIYGEGVDPENNSFTQASEKYDSLIESKVGKQNQLSRCKQDIAYFESRVEALKDSNGASSDEAREYVETRLKEIHTKINEIIEVVNITSDEYYEIVDFANAYNILVPASESEAVIQTNDMLIIVIVLEILIAVIYLGIAFLKGVVSDYRASKKAKIKETDTDEKSE